MGVLAWIYTVLVAIAAVGLLSAAGVFTWLFRRDKNIRDALDQDVYDEELRK